MLGRLPFPATWRAATYKGPHSGGAPMWAAVATCRCGNQPDPTTHLWQPYSLQQLVHKWVLLPLLLAVNCQLCSS